MGLAHTDGSPRLRAWLHVCRYLGLLHMEVFHQRLDQEYGASIITTTPTVPYSLKHSDGSTEEIQNPSQVKPRHCLGCAWVMPVAATVPRDYMLVQALWHPSQHAGARLEHFCITRARRAQFFSAP